MQNTLHPVFQSICEDIQAQPDLLRKAAYVSALRSMDWQFEYSDDQRAWRKGRAALEQLREEQSHIDPDGALWNQHCHAEYRLPERGNPARCRLNDAVSSDDCAAMDEVSEVAR